MSGTDLKPAPTEQGAERKFWAGVRILCAGEAWSLFFGSGLLWYLGLVHNAGLLVGVSACSVGMLLIGHQVEYWLAVFSREPLLNERSEIDSSLPMERALRYMLPPLIGSTGVMGDCVAHRSRFPWDERCLTRSVCVDVAPHPANLAQS